MKIDDKDSLWLSIQYSIPLVLSLIGLKLNLLTFGNINFGIWILLSSIWGVGSSLDLGFNISSIKFIAQYKNDTFKVNKIISTGFLLFIILGFIIIAAGYGATEMIYFQNRALIPAQMLSLSRIVEYLLAITFYLQFVFSVFRAIFEGHKDFILPAKISIASSIIQFALIVLIFLVKGNLIFLGLSNLCTTLLQGALFYYFLGKRYSELKIKLCYANYATFKEIAKFSISVQVINLLGSLLDPIIKYIIGSYSDKKMIPAYEIARKFALAISGLYSFTFKNALPNISTLSSTIDYQSFLFYDGVRLSKFGISFSGILFGVFSIFYAFLFKYFYNFDDSIIIFLILALSESLNNTGFILYVFILGIGKAAFLTILQGLNILLTALFLISGFVIFKSYIGLIGYYFSVILGNIIMMRYLNKHAEIRAVDFYKKTKITRLILFHFLLLADIVFLLKAPNKWMFSQIVFSLLCLGLFNMEIKRILIILKSALSLKHIAKFI